MIGVQIKTDLSQVEHLAEDFRRAEEVFIDKLTTRGAEIMREEEPERSGDLKRGTKAEVDRAHLSGEIVVEFTPKGGDSGSLSLPKGQGGQASGESSDSFFYPAGLLSGTGLYGPRGRVITPVNNRVLSFAIGGRRIFARSVRGMRPNPFDERTERRLLNETDEDFDAAMSEAGL